MGNVLNGPTKLLNRTVRYSGCPRGLFRDSFTGECIGCKEACGGSLHEQCLRGTRAGICKQDIPDVVPPPTRNVELIVGLTFGGIVALLVVVVVILFVLKRHNRLPPRLQRFLNGLREPERDVEAGSLHVHHTDGSATTATTPLHDQLPVAAPAVAQVGREDGVVGEVGEQSALLQETPAQDEEEEGDKVDVRHIEESEFASAISPRFRGSHDGNQVEVDITESQRDRVPVVPEAEANLGAIGGATSNPEVEQTREVDAVAVSGGDQERARIDGEQSPLLPQPQSFQQARIDGEQSPLLPQPQSFEQGPAHQADEDIPEVDAVRESRGAVGGEDASLDS